MTVDRAHRHARSQALNAYLAVLGAVAAAIVAVAAAHARYERPALMAVVAVAAAGLAFLPVLPSARGRALHSFTPVEVAVVLAAGTLSAPDALVAAGIAGVVELLFWPGCRHKAVYNATELVVGTAAAVAVANPGPVRTVGAVASLALAGIAFTVVTGALTHLVLVVAQGAGWADLRSTLRTAPICAATAVPLGILAAAVSGSWVLLATCLVPVGAMLMYASIAERSNADREQTTALAAAAQRIAGAATRDEVAAAVLDGAREIAGTDAWLAAAPAGGDVSIELAEGFGPDRWLVVAAPSQRTWFVQTCEPRLRTLASIAATSVDNVALHDRLTDLARTDELTGLGNRRGFVEHLEGAGARAARGRPFGVLFVDLDRFKAVNDTYGHSTGDAVLVAVADRLRRAVRAADRVFRLAGDEFTVVLDGVGDERTLATLCAQIEQRVAGDVAHDGAVVRVTASVGGAVWQDSADTAWSVVAAADAKMYDAKQRGVPA